MKTRNFVAKAMQRSGAGVHVKSYKVQRRNDKIALKNQLKSKSEF